jgi:outer membrane protein assembly factor BamB
VVRKVDPNGTQLWQIYYHVGEDYIHNITTDAQGDIYFTMEVRNVGNRVVKLNGTNGTVLWSTHYNSGASVGGNIRINANGDVIVGYSQTKAYNASTGALLWTSNTNGYNLETDEQEDAKRLGLL